MISEFLIYIAHRAIHKIPKRLRTYYLIKKLRKGHIKHHIIRYPKNNYIYNSYFKSFKDLICIFILYLLYSISGFENLKIKYFVLYTVILYNITHQIQHTKYFENYNIVKYHKIHHNKSTFNHGITSPIYDIIFGTMHKSCKLKKDYNLIYLFFPIISFKAIKIDTDIKG